MVILTALLASMAATVPCPLPPPMKTGTAGRDIIADDLLRLRDFGTVDVDPSAEPAFAPSPDGRWLAVHLRSADPQANAYCQGVVLVPVEGGIPRLVDQGGDLIRPDEERANFADFPSGVPAAIVPQWSPDGQAVFYLRKVEGIAQVWRATARGDAGGPVTRSSTDVLAFRVTPDGRAVLFETRPGLIGARDAIARAAREGWVYDDRFWSVSSDRPFPPRPPIELRAIALADSDERAATAGERDWFEAARQAATPGGPRTDKDAVARLRPILPTRYLGAAPLHVELATGPRACPEQVCGDGVRDFWWWQGDLIVLRAAVGRIDGATAVYRFNPRTSEVRRLFEDESALFGCLPLASELVCAHETATRPRHLVGIDLRHGRQRVLFDPNPGFAALRLGAVRRLSWRDENGIPAFGDLVLPPGDRSDRRYPLIVVQYESRGFLRGGTGDEAPVHLLAQAGYAVLSVDRPMRAVIRAVGAPDVHAFLAAATKDLLLRRRLLSSLLAGVARAVETGVIDTDRIGIAGFSDGADTACFALIHSSLFAAAAISSGCEDPATFMTMVGPSFTARLRRYGYPEPYGDRDDFWRNLSPARNPDRIRTPVLIQAADSEHRIALETWHALREAGRPIELKVFPDEHHVKWQPAHRAEIYRANLEWFDFWLRDQVSTDPSRRETMARWQALRALGK